MNHSNMTIEVTALVQAAQTALKLGVDVFFSDDGFRIRYSKKCNGEWLTGERRVPYINCATARINVLHHEMADLVNHVNAECEKRRADIGLEDREK